LIESLVQIPAAFVKREKERIRILKNLYYGNICQVEVFWEEEERILDLERVRQM
jgi:hypothetical protein